MLHTTWNRIRHGRDRLVLTVLAVALGVTFLTAALVLSASTGAALDDSYAQVYTGSDVVVRQAESFGDGPPGAGTVPLPDDTLEQVLAVAGVRDAQEQVRSVAQLVSAGGDGQAGVAAVVPDDPAMASVHVRSGRLPTGEGEVAVDAATAATHALEVGDRADVVLPAGPQEVEVVGTVGFGRLDGLAGGARLLFEAATAERLFGGSGPAEVTVRAAAGTSADELASRLAGTLDETVAVLTADEAAARDAAAAARQTAVLGWIVMAVAVVALVVGGFLVANTFRMLVAQRGRELALLRAVGASRRQVASSIRLEAAITGGLGAVVGVLLGVGAGSLLVATTGGLLPGMPPASATLTPAALLAGPLVGIGVAVVAARGAARRALSVSPVAAMRSATVSDARPSRTRLVAGGVVAAAGGAGTLLGVTAGATPAIVAGLLGVLAVIGLLFPLLTGPVLGFVSRPLAHAGATGALARQQALAAPRRTGATAAALAVTLALIGFLLVVSASLGAATPDLLAARQRADFSLRSDAPAGLHDVLFEIARAADDLPEVATARVVTYGEMQVVTGGDDPRPRAASPYVVDPTAAPELFDVRATRGDLDDVGTGRLALRESLATANGWDLGDRLAVTFPDATTHELEIAALFDGQVTTDWIVAPATADGHLPGAHREAFVRVARGADTDAVWSRLDGLVRGTPDVVLTSRDELAAQMAEENRTSLGIITALFALSLVVGVLGVVNTLTLAVHDRIREIGLLRAVGATRSQVRAIIRWEAAITSVLGALLGTVLGLGAAWVAVSALPEQALPFTVPHLHLGAAILATALLGVVASVVPAIRAARIDVLQALQHG